MTIKVTVDKDSILLKAQSLGYKLDDLILWAAYASLQPGITSIPVDVSKCDEIGLESTKVYIGRTKLPVRISVKWTGRHDSDLAKWLKENAKQMILNYSIEKARERTKTEPVLTIPAGAKSARLFNPSRGLSIRIEIEGGDSDENVG